MALEARVETGPVGTVVRSPNPAETVVLYLHGNDDLSGRPHSAVERAELLAGLTGTTVVCPRYQFPIAIEEVHTWHGSAQATGPVVIVGERMGAGLAAALLVRLRDSDVALPQCTVLVSALLDLSNQARSVLLNGSGDGITKLRRRDKHGADPVINPMHAGLHGLTPIQLLVASTDAQLDDSLAFASRAARFGVAVDLRVRPDAPTLQAESVPAIADFIGTWTRPHLPDVA